MPEPTDRQYLDDVPRELQDLLYEGRKIEAIKLAREKMGWGLKESKDRVDEVASRLSQAFPEGFAASGKSGCGTAVFVALLLAMAGVFAVVL
jgi:hypothetical protein